MLASNWNARPPATLIPPEMISLCTWVSAEMDFAFPWSLIMSSKYFGLVT